MNIRNIFAATLIVPALAMAHDHKKPAPTPPPEQTPTPAKSVGSGNAVFPTLFAVGGATLIGLAVYRSKTETEEKRVEVVPFEDGRGAKLAGSWRF